MALGLFARNGIKKVSMTDIAQAAGVSKRTLYEFFDDKETLLMQVLEATFVRIHTFIDKQTDENLTALDVFLLFNEFMLEKPTWYSQDFFLDIRRYPEAMERILGYKKTFLETVILLLKRGIREGVFDPDINFDVILLLARSHMNMSPPVELFGSIAPAEVHEAVFLIFVRGICTDAGRKILERYKTKKQFKFKL